MTDRLSGLHARLEALADQPVRGHPQVLDDVHRALVEELESLGRAGQQGTATS